MHRCRIFRLNDILDVQLLRRQLNFILKILQQLTSWYTKSAPIHHDHGHRRNLEPGEEIPVCVGGYAHRSKNMKKVQFREAILFCLKEKNFRRTNIGCEKISDNW